MAAAHLQQLAATAAGVVLQGGLGHADVDGLDLDVIVQRIDKDLLLRVREGPQVLAGQVHRGVNRRQRRVLHQPDLYQARNDLSDLRANPPRHPPFLHAHTSSPHAL